MIQPQFEILTSADSPEAEFVSLEVGRIVPVYEFLGGTTAWGAKLTSRWLRRVVWVLLEDLDNADVSHPTLRDAKMGHPGCLGRERWTELVFRRLYRRRCEAGWVCPDA